MHILVVDDDQLAGAMIGAVLETRTHQVSLAENAAEGMEHLGAQDDIQLIISDMHMPLMNGLEWFRELRNQGNDTPFILLTGDDPAALLQREPRLDDCLTKDADIEQSLPQAVQRIEERQ